MNFTNPIALLDAAAGSLVSVPGPIAQIAQASGAAIMSGDAKPDDVGASVGDIYICQSTNEIFVWTGTGWTVLSSAEGS